MLSSVIECSWRRKKPRAAVLTAAGECKLWCAGSCGLFGKNMKPCVLLQLYLPCRSHLRGAGSERQQACLGHGAQQGLSILERKLCIGYGRSLSRSLSHTSVSCLPRPQSPKKQRTFFNQWTILFNAYNKFLQKDQKPRELPGERGQLSGCHCSRQPAVQELLLLV